MKTFLIAASAALILTATAADAKGGKWFKHQDTDGDGFISLSEHLSHAEARFKKSDGNGDGKLSKEEAKAAREAMREKLKKAKENRKEHKSE